MLNMNTSHAHACGGRKRQTGSSLIEVLVTIFVVAVGLIGTAGLQLASTRYQHTSAMRSQALIEGDFIIEKMRVNNAVFARSNLTNLTTKPTEGYIAEQDYAAATTQPADPTCGRSGQTGCTAAESAQRDLREWREALAKNLPGGRGAIYAVKVGTNVHANARRVVVMWQEKAQLETDTVTATTDAGCPGTAASGVRCLNIWVTL